MSCGSRLALMTGSAQRSGWNLRVMRCLRCGFTHDRDVIGAVNLVRKLDVGGCAVGLPKGAHDSHTEWSVTTVKCGAKAQPILARPTMT